MSGQLRAPAALAPGKEPLIPIGYEVRLSAKTGLEDMNGNKIIASTGSGTPIVPRSQSLHRFKLS
jgi:hypothetical protein